MPQPSQTTMAAKVLVQPTPMAFCGVEEVSVGVETAEGRERRTIIGRTKAEAAAATIYRQALRTGHPRWQDSSPLVEEAAFSLYISYPLYPYVPGPGIRCVAWPRKFTWIAGLSLY